ncbi:MAG TPA: hypothetical protein PKI14_01595 [Fervidobacterium sp.]|nr:hypothetical protein [Fervidobacterium sp.]
MIYYNERLNLIGLYIKGTPVVKIEEKMNIFMALTKDWVLVGEL